MRICYMWKGAEEIVLEIYACNPENSSFKAAFSNMEIIECNGENRDLWTKLRKLKKLKYG